MTDNASNDQSPELAILRAVANYYNDHLSVGLADTYYVEPYDVSILCMDYSFGNWRAVLATELGTPAMYEAFYKVDTKELTVKAFVSDAKKESNAPVVEEVDRSTRVSLTEDGLLWVINSTVLHPRGFDLRYDPDTEALTLVGDGKEVFVFAEATAQDGKQRFEDLLDEHVSGNKL